MWVWRYELQSAGSLNAASSRHTFPGALIRMGEGFGCLHTWPELGDPTLERCLQSPGQHAIWKQTLACLAADGEARKAGASLFKGLSIPQSHATFPQVNEVQLNLARERGFSHVKAKISQSPEAIRPLIGAHQNFKWRLDFNGSGQAGMFDDWSDEERARLDFVEDPFPPEQGSWDDMRIVTAADRYEVKAPVRIIKPAIQPIVSGGRTVVTGYMDHPLGQSFAAYEAARAGVREVCGLQTHGLFQQDEFTEALGSVTPDFHPAEGSGLGFDDLLEKLPWKKLG